MKDNKHLFKKCLQYCCVFVFQSFLLGQSYHHYGIYETYKVKQVRIADEITGEKYENKIYQVYSYSDLMDRVLVYSKTAQDEEINFEFTSYHLVKKEECKLFLDIKNNSENSSIEIDFSDKNQAVTIGDGIFFLNTAYYLYVKEKLLKEKKISALVDLLDDFLEEYIYDLEQLKYLSSREKYKNKDFKILKAEITTVNGQNESINTHWKVYYSYKDGILVSVEQEVKDETRYKKRLLNHTGQAFTYTVFRQIDERFSDDKKITFNTVHNEYAENGTYFQVGINKETDYELMMNKSVKLSSYHFELNKQELAQIFKLLNNE